MWPLLALVGLIIIASSGDKKRGPRGRPLSRQDCIAKWSTDLAGRVNALPPDKAAELLVILRLMGANQAADCLEAKLATGTGDCFELIRAALVIDFSGLDSPAMARNIAAQARAQGLPDVAACFERLATELGSGGASA